MVKTASTQRLPLGAPAPAFALPDARGRTVTLAGQKGSALVVVFLCNHCPFVKHIRRGLADFARDVVAQGVSVVGINSNDIERYPDDAPDKMLEEILAAGYVFPYLLDEEQLVAKAYGAACTPDFFVFDSKRRLVYRGQFDDSRPGNGVPVTGVDLRAAVAATLEGRPAPSPQKPSLGCNIKWRPGNEPEWFAA